MTFMLIFAEILGVICVLVLSMFFFVSLVRMFSPTKEKKKYVYIICPKCKYRIKHESIIQAY